MTLRRKITRQLGFEHLQARELMAVDVAVTNGVLNIRGGSGRDHVEVHFDQRLQQATVKVDNRHVVAPIAASRISSIDVRLGAGADNFQLSGSQPIHDTRPNVPRPLTLNSVTIDMGTGTNETRLREGIGLTNVIVRNLTLSGASTNGVNAVLATVNVTSRASVNFAGTGSDVLTIRSGSLVNDLWARFGAGDDTFNVSGGAGDRAGREFYNQVNRADVEMGTGRDQVFIANNSNIRAGRVDGGSDADNQRIQDRFQVSHLNRTAIASGFEQVIRRA